MSRNLIPASILLALASVAPAHANNWEVYKYAEIGVSGTDNFGLNSSDQAQELVGSVKPSVELVFSGNRFNTDINAEVEFYRFRDIGENLVDPRLEVATKGTLVENLLYVKSSLNVGKLFPGEDFFSLKDGVDEDPDTKARFRFNPFFSRKFGRFADVYLGYGHQSTDNEIDGEIDTQQDTLSFHLGRDPKYGGLLWGVGAEHEKDRSGDLEYKNTSLYGSLGATLGQSVYFEVLGGAETNNFAEQLGNEEETAMWEAALKWTPNELTSLKVGYGERFFGEGPTFALKHRLRNSILSASWTRGVSAASDPSLGSVSTFTDGTETTGIQLDSDSPFSEDVSTTASVPYIDRTLKLGYKIVGRRSDLILDAVYATQEPLIAGAVENENLLGRLVFDRHLSPLTTFRIQYDHKTKISEDSAATVTDADENRLAFSFIYNFDRKERNTSLPDTVNVE